MNSTTLTQTQTLADLLERQPLAGFLALTILGLVTLFVMLTWERRSNSKTLREVVTLTSVFTEKWNAHQDLERQMIELVERHAPKSPPPSPSKEAA